MGVLRSARDLFGSALVLLGTRLLSRKSPGDPVESPVEPQDELDGSSTVVLGPEARRLVLEGQERPGRPPTVPTPPPPRGSLQARIERERKRKR